jgi:hypothetical protein
MSDVIELTLVSGARIAIIGTDISCLCEIKQVKGVKAAGKCNVKLTPEDAGWDVTEEFADVLKWWKNSLDGITIIGTDDI